MEKGKSVEKEEVLLNAPQKKPLEANRKVAILAIKLQDSQPHGKQ